MSSPTKEQLQHERMLSYLRMLQAQTRELINSVGVLNRKVELIHDQQQTDSFLKEEDPAKARPRDAHQAVQSLSQADA